MLGCGPPPVPETPVAPTPPGLPHALEELVPGEPVLVLVVHPSRALLHDSSREVFELFVPDESRQRLADRVGVAPETIEELIYVAYEDGFLTLLRAPRSMDDVVVAHAMRMNTLEVESSQPFERRVGFLGAERREVVALDDDVLLIAGGGIGAEVAGLLAEVTRLRGLSAVSSPAHPTPAMARAPAIALHRTHAESAAVLYLPTGLRVPPGPLAMLFARTDALALALDPTSDGFVVRAGSRGELPPGAADNLRALFRSMAASDFGAAMGLRELERSLELEVVEQGEGAGARARARWPLAALLRGLEIVVAPDLRALIEGTAGPASASP